MNANAVKARFIERDFYKQKMLDHSEFLTEAQIDKILDSAGVFWVDLTFKFYDNGTLSIIDNNSEQPVELKELKGAAYDFYVKERIRMIRGNLLDKILQSA